MGRGRVGHARPTRNCPQTDLGLRQLLDQGGGSRDQRRAHIVGP